MLNNIKKYDIRHGMKLGVWQTNILHRFIIKNFNTESYKCGTNGLISYIKGVNDSGYGYSIEIEERDWTINRVHISYNKFEQTSEYSTVYEFKDIMEKMEICI